MFVKKNKELVRLYFETFFAGDIEIYDQILSPTFYVCHLRDRGKPVPDEQRGAEPFKRGLPLFRSAFSEGRITIDEMIVAEDRVVVCWTLAGVQQGTFLGMAPTGKLIRYSGVNGFRIEENKLVECWDIQDSLSLFQQLGILPATPQILEQARQKEPQAK